MFAIQHDYKSQTDARFPSIYTAADVDLLAYVDRAHGDLSGPATRTSRILAASSVGGHAAAVPVRDPRLPFRQLPVAGLLDKLLIEQTRSRAHHCGDNGLVESNSGAILRKHIGHNHIAAQHAEAMNQFHRDYLNPYVNFHRPCAVPTVLTQANGKRRRIYQRWATPREIFGELPASENFLRPGITLAELEDLAQRQTDTEAALAMQRAKRKLFGSFKEMRTA